MAELGRALYKVIHSIQFTKFCINLQFPRSFITVLRKKKKMMQRFIDLPALQNYILFYLKLNTIILHLKYI